MPLSLVKNTKIHLLLIAIAVFASYSNIYKNEFLGDDLLHIETWQDVKDLRNIPNFFAGKEFSDARIRYRPVGSSFIALNYALWGKNPLGYHVTFITLHLINTALFYFIAKNIGKNPLVALASASIFGVHPVTGEVVNIVFSSISLGFTFYLASFWLFLKSQGGKNRQLYILSLVFFIMASFSYELTLSLPLAILLYIVIFLRKKSIFRTLQFHFKTYIPYFAVVLFYLGLRTFILHISAKADYLVGSFYLTMLVMSKVFLKYILLVIYPSLLSINHTVLAGVQVWVDPFTNNDAIRSLFIFQPNILFNFLVLGGMLVGAVMLFKRIPVVSFAIGWFFVTLLPVSYLLPQDTIMQERYLYLGAFGIILLVMLGLYILTTKRRLAVFVVLVLILVSAYGTRTYLRNQDWKDPITMWSSMARQLPNHVMTHVQLAYMYEEAEQYSKAIETFNKVIALEPRIPEAYYQLGNIYQTLGQKEKALQYYNDALALLPGYLPAKQAVDLLTNPKSASVYLHWRQYVIDDKISFFYPKEWKTQKINEFVSGKIKHGVTIKTSEDSFYIAVVVGQSELMQQQESYGSLVNQGLASAPNFDQAFVKIFKDENTQKMLFYLFKGDLVLKILVYPSDSLQMKTFDQIVQSILPLK